ncbi:PhzF family phenazine biosynthesis protein [Streptomyces sp. NPDC059373]
MADLHEVLRVFTGPDGRGGNALGVVRDGAAVPSREGRQALAAELGFSETVFVDDAEAGTVDIYTPSVRLAFAGYPLVGVGWLLGVDTLRPEAGVVRTWPEGDVRWIRARPEWVTGKRTERYGTVAEVDALPAPPPGDGWVYAWAWADEAAGRVRARGFPRRGDGIAEDEATGAAALVLSGELGRGLDVRQGVGSQILTRMNADGTVEIGGRVSRS